MQNQKSKFQFYPLILSLFPGLSLWAFNRTEMPAWMVIRPLIISCGAVLLVYIVFRLILKDWEKAALFSSACTLLFFSYGHTYDVLRTVQLFGIVPGRHRLLIPIFVLVAAVLFLVIFRTKKNLAGINLPVTIISLFLLVFPTYQLAGYFIQTSRSVSDVATNQTNVKQNGAGLAAGSGLQGSDISPDVYYIILDAYTRQDTLKANFNYDNSGFIDQLKSLGFYVADCSMSNYSQTELSLPSSLNMDYLSSLVQPSEMDEEHMAALLSDNRVRENFHALGYQIVNIESGYGPTEWRDADQFISQDKNEPLAVYLRGLNPFETMYLNTTGLSPLLELGNKLPPALQIQVDYPYVQHRNRILYALKELPEIAKMPGRKFVFVHLLIPHSPIVFGPNGEQIQRNDPFSLKADVDLIAAKFIPGYTGQITYANTRMLEIVQSILKNSKEPSVIILQGDHGAKPLKGTEEDRMTILNAYYLPDHGEQKIYSSISPVNSFRLVFNTYFHGNYPFLDDKHYFSKYNNTFGFDQLSEPDPGCRS